MIWLHFWNTYISWYLIKENCLNMRCESVERVMLHGEHRRGEWTWTMVTVSLVICNLATRVRWSFSEFKMSHYIDWLPGVSFGRRYWCCGGVEMWGVLGDISVSAVASARVTSIMATQGRMSRPGFYPRHHHVLKRRVHQFWHRSTSLFTMFGKCLPGIVSMLKGPNSTFKIVKLREREGQRVDLRRSLKGHL